jgi:hypothetical protein
MLSIIKKIIIILSIIYIGNWAIKKWSNKPKELTQKDQKEIDKILRLKKTFLGKKKNRKINLKISCFKNYENEKTISKLEDFFGKRFSNVFIDITFIEGSFLQKMLKLSAKLFFFFIAFFLFFGNYFYNKNEILKSLEEINPIMKFIFFLILFYFFKIFIFVFSYLFYNSFKIFLKDKIIFSLHNNNYQLPDPLLVYHTLLKFYK